MEDKAKTIFEANIERQRFRFRAFETHTKQWHTEVQVDHLGFPMVRSSVDHRFHPTGGVILQQATGLCDVNGTPVFEGDILQLPSHFYNSLENHPPLVVTIVWENGSFMCQNGTFKLALHAMISARRCMGMKVIDNIFHIA